MDFITKKTNIMPWLWSSTTTQPAEKAAESPEPKDKAPVIVVNGESPDDSFNADQKNHRPLSTSTVDATSVPLPLSPISPKTIPPEITKATTKRRRRTRSFTPSKVFLLKAPAAKRTEGKKNRLAASDVTVHFPKIHIDKGVPEDMQERLVEASNAVDVDLDGHHRLLPAFELKRSTSAAFLQLLVFEFLRGLDNIIL
ncbi:hypothetical protein AA313_de0208282 [Arthrobotrys entomopaga]|nr:hypothetical protein AA313_de0208282 [Arthrobotrys entomopaga]